MTRQIGKRELGGTLDHALVVAEQGRLQEHVDAQQRCHPHEWQAMRRELNDLLNVRYATSFLARFCSAADRLWRVLPEVRRDVHSVLDFANESLRIRIGLQLIEFIRRDNPLQS
jgi:hypothetical protein